MNTTRSVGVKHTTAYVDVASGSYFYHVCQSRCITSHSTQGSILADAQNTLSTRGAQGPLLAGARHTDFTCAHTAREVTSHSAQGSVLADAQNTIFTRAREARGAPSFPRVYVTSVPGRQSSGAEARPFAWQLSLSHSPFYSVAPSPSRFGTALV